MSPFTVLVLCIQACLIQSVLSQLQCGCNSGYRGVSVARPVAVASAPAVSSCGSYGGAGTGQVGVEGNVCASGTTTVVGSVPTAGTASFSGTLPACGSVSITGQCGCGCI